MFARPPIGATTRACVTQVISVAYGWCRYPTRQRMCMSVKERLALVVEKRNLFAEEQGGFRKGWGCRDQILTLMLVGQVQMAMK